MKTARIAVFALALASLADARAARDNPLDYGPAAAAVAAYVVMECLFPEREPDLAVALAVRLADFPETDAKAAALANGRRVATEMVGTRCHRHSAARMEPEPDSVITRLGAPGR